jgi:hypothetical protein
MRFVVPRHPLSFLCPPPAFDPPVLVDCCLFTPAVAATPVITGAVAVASATTITATVAAVITDVIVNATAINTATAAAAAAGAHTDATWTELIIPNGTEPGILIQRLLFWRSKYEFL